MAVEGFSPVTALPADARPLKVRVRLEILVKLPPTTATDIDPVHV
jgi:hypothetical protein